MKQLEIYQKIADAVNAAAGSKNPKMTIVGETHFGGYYCLPVRAVDAEIGPCAQYKESLLLVFHKKGCTKVTALRLYGTRPFALFSGWRESSFELPNIYGGFDKNIFYGIVDGIDAKYKICEESERVHLSEIQQKGKVYKVVSMNPDDPQPRMIVETYETAEHLKKAFETSGEFRSVSCRAELQGAPKLKNFCGPMYDGEDSQGRAVIRYETQEVYDILSA